MAKTIANPESLSLGKALGHAAKMIRLLEEAGLSQEALQRPIDDPDCRRELVVYWESLVHPANPDAPTCTMVKATQIMGNNFHGPAVVRKHLGINLGHDKRFKTVPFSAQELSAVAGTHVLVAVPAVSIMDIHTKAAQAFYSQSDPWYGERWQEFAYAELEPGWYLVRKDEVPDSTSKRWNEQAAMVAEPDFVPEANLAVYAWVLHYLATDERMFAHNWVRTNSVTAKGNRVNLDGNVNGLNVNNWDDNADSNIGVSLARNFHPQVRCKLRLTFVVAKKLGGGQA